MITIVLNGKKEELEKELTVLELLKKKNIRPEVVTVELNEKILGRQEFEQTIIRNNDKIEFVYFMGGGGSTQLPSAVLLTVVESKER
ncbi:MAG: sulfur carrier protein ThiS [Candidatus Omnitrophota bacterium]